jgi:hypothetical protein
MAAEIVIKYAVELCVCCGLVKQHSREIEQKSKLIVTFVPTLMPFLAFVRLYCCPAS